MSSIQFNTMDKFNLHVFKRFLFILINFISLFKMRKDPYILPHPSFPFHDSNLESFKELLWLQFPLQHNQGFT